MSKIIIYTLTEKGTNDVRYVGKTVDMYNRLRGHLNGEMAEGNPKSQWIKDVISRGGEITISQIDECEQYEAYNREAYWINFYRKEGYNLTNTITLDEERVVRKVIDDDRTEEIFEIINRLGEALSVITGGKTEPSVLSTIAVMNNVVSRLASGLIKHKCEIENIKKALLNCGIDTDAYHGMGDGI